MQEQGILRLPRKTCAPAVGNLYPAHYHSYSRSSVERWPVGPLRLIVGEIPLIVHNRRNVAPFLLVLGVLLLVTPVLAQSTKDARAKPEENRDKGEAKSPAGSITKALRRMTEKLQKAGGRCRQDHCSHTGQSSRGHGDFADGVLPRHGEKKRMPEQQEQEQEE